MGTIVNSPFSNHNFYGRDTLKGELAAQLLDRELSLSVRYDVNGGQHKVGGPML